MAGCCECGDELAVHPVTVRSKAYVCGASMAGIAGSNPAEVVDNRLLCLLCWLRLVRRAYQWCRVVLPVVAV